MSAMMEAADAQPGTNNQSRDESRPWYCIRWVPPCLFCSAAALWIVYLWMFYWPLEAFCFLYSSSSFLFVCSLCCKLWLAEVTLIRRQLTHHCVHMQNNGLNVIWPKRCTGSFSNYFSCIYYYLWGNYSLKCWLLPLVWKLLWVEEVTIDSWPGLHSQTGCGSELVVNCPVV